MLSVTKERVASHDVEDDLPAHVPLGDAALRLRALGAREPGGARRAEPAAADAAPATTGSPSTSHPLGDIDGQRYLLTGPVTVIGRGSEADIVVDDPGVSRRHLEIRVTPEGVIATDLGSTNGLFVEGHQVPAATLLDGNSLTIGRTRIMFWTGASDNEEW